MVTGGLPVGHLGLGSLARKTPITSDSLAYTRLSETDKGMIDTPLPIFSEGCQVSFDWEVWRISKRITHPAR